MGVQTRYSRDGVEWAMRRLLPLLLLLSACASPAVRRAPPPPVDPVKAAVRAEAQRLYGAECGRVILPDRAFAPIEVTGGGEPEVAVLLGRAVCERLGNSQLWQGTGGAVVQVWLAEGGPPRMLLEHQMHGFTPVPRGLLSLQHGGFCPGGAGPGVCLVTYQWNDRDRALEVAHRQPYDDQHPGTPRTMDFDYAQISR